MRMRSYCVGAVRMTNRCITVVYMDRSRIFTMCVAGSRISRVRVADRRIPDVRMARNRQRRRVPAIAERLASAFRLLGKNVQIRHRTLDKRSNPA